MKKTLLVAASGLLYFVFSLFLFMPLRMNPVPNYLLVILFSLIGLMIFLFLKMVQSSDEKAYLYAFFTGILLWQVVGELFSIRVPQGLVLQLSTVNIKVWQSYPYLILGWFFLVIVWRTRLIPNKLNFCMAIFLGIWSFELYMENYSGVIPIRLMPIIANVFLCLSLLLSIWILYRASKTTSLITQIALGGALYLTLSVLIMSTKQWQKPQVHYLKYEKEYLQEMLIRTEKQLKYLESLTEQ